MPLSENLKDQFAKMVNADNPKENTDNTVYGTVKVYSDGTKAVVLDGSNIATPFETVTDAEDGDRVTVTIRNHKAVVTGNLSSPAARTDAVKTNSEKIGEFNTVLSNKVDTDELDTQIGRIDILESDNATIKQKLTASEGEFKEIKTKQLEVEEKVTAAEAEIKTIKSDKIDATVVESEYTKTKVFDALAGTVGTLNGDFSNFKNTTTEKLDAQSADIDELNTKKLNSEDADLKYANIDFTNIGKAAMEYFYAQSGLIKNVVVGDQTITGELIGVTIKGDLIEGNTVVADKLVIKGEDGLYYKLNTDGITTEIEQTDYNSINGQVIRAKSVTASKIDVKDLVAFDATIAGFKIDDNAIHSIGKESATSGVRGIYLGKDGQMAVGDSNHYIKYYKDTDGSFKLAISAESMEFSSGTSVKDAIDNINNKVDNIKSIKNTAVTYQVGDSNTKAPTGTWSPNIPSVPVGKYLWTRTVFTYSDDTISTSYGISSMGAKGETGARGPAGKGIKSTSVTYQAGASGTTAPTGAWSITPPTTTEAASYLWTRTVITYTDNTTSTSYSVGSTPAGILSTVNSKITKTKEEIAQSVSKTYQTKDAMGNYYTTKQVDSAINTRCGQVELKVDGKLADLKSNTNATLKLCVKEDETGRLKSMIEAIADTINITAKGGLNLTGNRFSVTSTNLTITKDGSMTCKNLSVTGGNIDILADDYQTGKISTHANWYTSSLSPFGLTATGRFNNATYSNSGIEFAKNGSSESVVVIGCSSEVDHISIYANSAKITSQLTIPIGYNKLNQRATTSANDTQAFSYAWTINGTGLFILNAGLWTDTTDDYGTTNCAIYVNGACVTANTHRYGESSNSVELDAGATFVYWFRNAKNQKVLLLAGSTKTGNKTLTYTVQGLFGLAVT